MLDTPTAYALAIFAAFCVGVSKAGFSGTSLLAVAIFTHLYGAKAQAGLALPLLIVADLTVYPLFRKHGSWSEVWRLLPATLVGLAIGYVLLDKVPEPTAKRIIGGIILFMLALQLLRLWKPGTLERLANSKTFGTSAGVAGGTTTMLANAAGPVVQLYLLSRRIPKMELIGIGARFFLLVNLLKLPLGGKLDIITTQSLLEDLKLIPAVLLGIFIGKKWLEKVPQQLFEWLILITAAIAAARMLV